VSTNEKEQKRQRYPGDMSENGWKKFKQAMPVVRSASKSSARPAVDVKEVINAILLCYRRKWGLNAFYLYTPLF